jgi:thioesterase domain-containing protein
VALAILDGAPGLTAAALPAGVYDDDAWWLAEVGDYARRLWGRDLALSYDELARLAPEARLARAAQRLCELGLPAAVAGPEALRRLLAVFKANTRALERYVPRRFAGRITLFRPAAALRGLDGDGDPALGWGELTPHPVAIEEVPGDHLGILAEPHVRTLAARLRAWAERARRGEI